MKGKVFIMKKLAVLFMVGSLVVSGATTSISTVKAADTKKPAETKIIDKNMDLKETDKDFFAYPGKSENLKSLSDFLRKDTKLTKAEKSTLTKAYEKFLKTRKDINTTYTKIDSVAKKITSNWAIEDKLDKLANKHKSLWDKLYNKATDKELAIDDNIEFIKSSKALTDKEKETLIKAEKEIDKLNKEYDKVEKATKDLNSKLDSLYKDIEKLMDEVQPLADKLGKNFKDKFGFTEKIPY